jgi:hypothetical protein
MRQWQKIQKMLRSLSRARFTCIGFTLCAAAISAHGAIFPDKFGAFKKIPTTTVAVPDQPLYEEYGLETSEQAQYSNDAQKFNATAWRLKDSTCAMALFQARRPPGATASKLTKLAALTSDGVILAFGNYVFQFTGWVPKLEDLDDFFRRLPRLEQAPLPTFASYLPSDGLIPNSERYIVGPVSLERFYPTVPPSVAAFHMGAEAQIAKYQSGGSTMALGIFSYPTPNMARDRAVAFQALPGAIVKRTGPLLAVIFSPADPDAAERLLAKVNYLAQVTLHEQVPVKDKWTVSSIVLTGMVMAGIVLCFCIVAGLAVGGVRVWLRKVRKRDSEDVITLLNLTGR